MKTFKPGMVANACNPSSRWRQQGQRFKVSLGYMRPCIKNQTKTKPQKKKKNLLFSFLSLSPLLPIPSSISLSPSFPFSPSFFPPFLPPSLLPFSLPLLTSFHSPRLGFYMQRLEKLCNSTTSLQGKTQVSVFPQKVQITREYD